MRKFRFIGDPKDYKVNEPAFKVGEVYKGDFIGKDCLASVQEYATRPWSSSSWQEVTEPEPIQLHKDTDLGYFAGLAMRGLLANSHMIEKYKPEYIVELSAQAAQELIKQLNEVSGQSSR